MNNANFSNDGLQKIDRHFDDYISARKIAGCSLLLWQQGAERHTMFKGVQFLESDTCFARCNLRIYSMTKPVMSVALMMLGSRKLRSEISRFLQKFREMTLYHPAGDHVSAAGQITLRPFKSHRALFRHSRTSAEGLRR